MRCRMRPRGPSAPDVVPTDAPTRDRSPDGSGWVLLVGLVGLVFTMGAVALEVVSSSYANSAVPGWAEWVPLAWPQPLRVVWWLAVAATAAGFRWSLGRVGMPTSRVVTVLTVGPFVVLAVGIGAGADWATWH